MMIMTKKDVETKITTEGLVYRYKGTEIWHPVIDEGDLYEFEEVEETES